MVATRQRLAENAAGDFFVNDACIDCATCNWVAPSVFAPGHDASFVYRQPGDPAEIRRAEMALLSCPVAAIETAQKHDFAMARAGFPDHIDGPVYHCGYHAAASFGAASYLIIRDGGNILVDSPRFTSALVRAIEARGGLRWMFLTHRDDIADHHRFAAHFACRRVMHADDIGPRTRSVEIVLEGERPYTLEPGVVAIPVPGHTRGSVCLLIDDTWLFTGDHLEWDAEADRLTARREVCWYDWGKQTRSMQRLREFRFEWVLPGHGHRGYLPEAEMRRSLERCIERMQTS